MRRNRPIGVFDSGVGGLTVVRELERQLPYENIIYFGDTARIPYGTKSEETIVRFSVENVRFLLGFDVKLIVIACNTSSSLSLPVLKKKFRLPIIGVVSPVAREAVRITFNKQVGVIGTPATIKSRSYEKEIRRLDPQVKVLTQSCPLFVPLVEEGWIKDKVTFDVATKYLGFLKESGVDTLILGCTHYPLLKDVIRKVLGEGIALLDSARQTAIETKEVLIERELNSSSLDEGPRLKFFVSDEPGRFAEIGMRFLGREIGSVEKVSI